MAAMVTCKRLEKDQASQYISIDVGGACEASFLLAVVGCGKEEPFSSGMWSVVGCQALQ